MKKYCIYLHYCFKANNNTIESKPFLSKMKNSEIELDDIENNSNLFIDSYFNCINKINEDKKDLFKYIEDEYGVAFNNIHCEYKIIEWRGNAKRTISQLEENAQ